MSGDRHDTARDVDVVEKKTLFQGYFRVDAYRLRHQLHAGGMSGEMRREVFERGHAVAVLPYDPALRAIVMLEQFRVGAYAAGRPPWLTEIVAGIIGAGETPEQVARRELAEEAGLTAQNLKPMLTCLTTPGGSSETVEMFAARVDASRAGGIHGLDHEHEDIRVFVLPVIDAFRNLREGRYDNAQALIALQWLALNENDLRAAWGFDPV